MSTSGSAGRRPRSARRVRECARGAGRRAGGARRGRVEGLELGGRDAVHEGVVAGAELVPLGGVVDVDVVEAHRAGGGGMPSSSWKILSLIQSWSVSAELPRTRVPLEYRCRAPRPRRRAGSRARNRGRTRRSEADLAVDVLAARCVRPGRPSVLQPLVELVLARVLRREEADESSDLMQSCSDPEKSRSLPPIPSVTSSVCCRAGRLRDLVSTAGRSCQGTRRGRRSWRRCRRRSRGSGHVPESTRRSG